MYREETIEWQEAKKYGQLTEVLGRQNGMGIGFESLRLKLMKWEEDKEWNAG